MFEVGDKVRCVGEDGWGLTQGRIYTVSHCDGPYVRVERSRFIHRAEHFELIKETVLEEGSSRIDFLNITRQVSGG